MAADAVRLDGSRSFPSLAHDRNQRRRDLLGLLDQEPARSRAWSVSQIFLAFHASDLCTAVLFGVAFFVVSPAAILIARFCRKSPWFKWHALLHLFALVLVFAGLGLGIYRAGAHRESLTARRGKTKFSDPDIVTDFDSLHTQLGFAVSLIVALQGIFTLSDRTTTLTTSSRGRDDRTLAKDRSSSSSGPTSVPVAQAAPPPHPHL